MNTQVKAGKRAYGKYEEDDIFAEIRNHPSAVRYWSAGATNVNMTYPVLQQPINKISLIAANTLDRLDYMNAAAFHDYVFRKLKPRQQEQLFRSEKYRCKTFMAFNRPFPRNGALSGIKMAEAGFFYRGFQDTVCCAFCWKTFSNWRNGDLPRDKHKQLNSSCKFVRNPDRCGNIPHDESIAPHHSTLRHNDIGSKFTIFEADQLDDSQHDKTKNPTSGVFRATLGISTNMLSAAPAYATPSARRLTFTSRWPFNAPAAQKMSDAGYWCTGFADEVSSFCCAVKLKDWRWSDDPWEQHALSSPRCAYILEQKGQQFISDVQKVHRKNTVELCQDLGHSKFVIELALLRNGKLFHRIAEMLDAIDAIEGEGQQTPDSLRFEELHSSSDHLVNVNLAQFSSVNLPPLAAAGRQPPGLCKCFNSETPADCIGLPCGHLIFCNACNKEEKRKVDDNPSYRVVCPYVGCGQSLAASMKIFLS